MSVEIAKSPQPVQITPAMLRNCAAWNADAADRATTPAERHRHERTAKHLFFLAWRAS